MPIINPPIQTVKHGGLQIEIRKYSDGRYGFDSNEGGKRLQVRRTTAAQAVVAANESLKNGKGKLNAAGINHDEIQEFLRWKSVNSRRVLVPDLVKEFLEAKKGENISPPTFQQLKYALNAFSKRFTGALNELGRPDVLGWLNGLKTKKGPISDRRWNNIRAAIISLHRYAREDRLLPAEKTPVETIKKKRITREGVSTYTPKELERLLKAVKERSERTGTDWLPVIILGAFCGIRPEELAPDPYKSKKPGLRWENILWAKRSVAVPANVSKTRMKRLVTLCAAARAWLEPYKHHQGQIAPEKGRFTDQIPAWEEDSGVDWKQDALRHSYASYRLAIEKDTPRLALEMGNSVSMIFKHYLDLKHEKESRAWFAIRPDGVTKVTKTPKKDKKLSAQDSDFTEKRARRASF